MYETLKEPIIQVYGDLKWFHFSQNNSGGYFIENNEVGSEVYIQAVDAKTAIKKAEHVFEEHSEYCDCCGERWSYYVDDDDGYLVPTRYGKPMEESDRWFGKTAILHHADGKVERYTFNKTGN